MIEPNCEMDGVCTVCGERCGERRVYAQLDWFREENARLRSEIDRAAIARGMMESDLERLTRERDEDRALEAKLAKVVEIAHDGQCRDALHAFDALLKIQSLAAAKGEE